MSEIKCKNLQIQYDELVARTADKCEQLQDVGNEKVVIEDFLQRQAAQNNELMSKFMAEITQLRHQVARDAKNQSFESVTGREIELLSKTQ